MSALDWPAMLQAGLRGLGLKPAEFWALTPAELHMLLGSLPGPETSLGRRRLEELLAAYPDRPGKGDDCHG